MHKEDALRAPRASELHPFQKRCHHIPGLRALLRLGCPAAAAVGLLGPGAAAFAKA